MSQDHKSIAKAVGAAVLAALQGAEKFVSPDNAREEMQAARMVKQNRDGGILMCKLSMPRVKGAPNPSLQVVNEEIFWIPRGVDVVVPWYLIEQMKLNIEKKYRQEKDPVLGRNVVIGEDSPAESFNYTPINPAEGVEV